MVAISEFCPSKDIKLCQKRLNAVQMLLEDCKFSNDETDLLFKNIDDNIEKLMAYVIDIFENEEVTFKSEIWKRMAPKLNAIVFSETEKARKEDNQNGESC